MDSGNINVLGARVHNLKNIDVTIPRHKLTVITGLSGSGKSSLAFDTIYAEGQRRYIETFSAYARNFLGNLERPDVDEITGLSPVISIEQKTTNKNPRSTVGTVTEIYDYMRLLFARASTAYSYATGEKMVKYTDEQVLDMITHDYAGRRILILAPLVRSRKGHYRELFEDMRRKGYLTMRVDGQLTEVTRGMKVDRYKNHDIEVVIDKLIGPEGEPSERLRKSVATAMKQGDGLIMIMDKDTGEVKFFSRRLMCPTTGMAYNDPAPHLFSFNSPQGACPRCRGLGVISQFDIDKVMPNDKLSIREGGIVPLGKYKNTLVFWQIDAILKKYDCQLTTPLCDIPEEAMNEVLYGSLNRLRIEKEVAHTTSDYFVDFGGVVDYLKKTIESSDDSDAQKKMDQYMTPCECPECHGQRLKREALAFRLWDKNIAQLSAMDIEQLREWLDEVPDHLEKQQGTIATEILKELRTRLDFLLEVGLDYLSLNRPSYSLSGGESQRIRLATQIGSGLVNVLYILDEPSIGLHQRDNQRLIESLCRLRDIGNTVIVVEHDRDMMLAADYIVDIGPGAGRNGGEVVFQGTPQEMLNTNTLTAQYLNGERQMAPSRLRPKPDEWLTLRGATGHNLKKVDLKLPLGRLVLITGVSGSGKSSLVRDTLLPLLSAHFYRSLAQPLPYESIENIGAIDKVVSVDQSPLGRTPRSNAATYTGLFGLIRSLFVALPEARIRGYKPGRFSFNVKGGRCEACGGNGYKTIEMNFLPDVQVPCPECQGRRYNRETLEVRYKGKSIADVLAMTIDQAVEFFAALPDILRRLETLQQVGLGYITLGQPSTTLSGGESQRVKLATELAKRDTGRTLYLLDEPTTGLHFADITMLMDVLQRLVDRGNTVVVIEHNMDVIAQADHIIDLGPDGGRRGGRIIAQGSPAEVAANKESITGQWLRKN